jgi:hypothetical protein
MMAGRPSLVEQKEKKREDMLLFTFGATGTREEGSPAADQRGALGSTA